MKLNCIIDTNTCIHLSNTGFRQKTLLEYFNSTAFLNYSKEVHLELRDHKDKNLPAFIHNQKRKLATGKYSISEYEKRLVGEQLISRKKKGDKGEIDNFLVSVDQIHYFKKSNVIYITDDEKALNGVLNEWIGSFPAISFWTSYDVILYLYAERIIPSKEIAMDIMQDIINFSAPKLKDRSDKTTAKITKLKVTYTNRIERISKILN
jgi:hypothetical protein